MLFVLSSHSSVFAHPLAPDEAMSNVEALIRLPHIRVLSEEEGYWEIYREIARDVPA